MEISVEQADPALNDTRPHYCAASGRFIGLRIGSRAYIGDVYCPWCGVHVGMREPNRDYARRVRPERYDGPRCAHGYPDVTCVALAAAYRRAPLLTHQLGEIALALGEDLRAAEAVLRGLRDDLRWLNEAFRELFDVTMQRRSDPQRSGFVYLIGHERAVKIGWSDRHPAAPGGRLAELQTGSCDELEVLGLIEGSFSLEREIQARFSKHRLRGEWFRRHREILEYFVENGLPE